MAQNDRSERERESAKAQRDDYVRALKEELEGVKASGKDERAKAIEAELQRMSKATTRTPVPQAKA